MDEILKYFKKTDPVIFQELTKMKLTKLKGLTDPTKYFRKLCREIIGQQLAGKAAEAITKRFEAKYGNNIIPNKLMKADEKELREIGMSWAKARYIKDLAMKVQSGEVDLPKLPLLPDEEVITELVKVKGVGRWTAEMFLIFTLGREDVFSFGDLGLKRGFRKLYGLSDKAAEKKMKIITKKWSPYRSYASLALWNAVE